MYTRLTLFHNGSLILQNHTKILGMQKKSQFFLNLKKPRNTLFWYHFVNSTSSIRRTIKLPKMVPPKLGSILLVGEVALVSQMVAVPAVNRMPTSSGIAKLGYPCVRSSFPKVFSLNRNFFFKYTSFLISIPSGGIS